MMIRQPKIEKTEATICFEKEYLVELAALKTSKLSLNDRYLTIKAKDSMINALKLQMRIEEAENLHNEKISELQEILADSAVHNEKAFKLIDLAKERGAQVDVYIATIKT